MPDHKFHHIFSKILVFVIALFFFVLPFFWYQFTFVDLGSDCGRLYLFDPIMAYNALVKNQNLLGIFSYAMIPHFIVLYGLSFIARSPAVLISIDHGLQLSLGFYFMYRIIMIFVKKEGVYEWIHDIAGIVGGIVYIAFITVFGWQQSLLSHHQVFLNPLLFFLLLQYCLTENMLYGFLILGISIIYSGNFGFASTPQLFSFFPLSLLFLLLYISLILKKNIPWKKLGMVGIAFVGLHAFHIVPMIGSLLDRGGAIYNSVLTEEAIGNRGVYYFDFNHKDLGKISTMLFQPSQWHGQTVYIFLIPFIAFFGFLKKPSKLLALIGVFFLATFFLVSANITNIGTQFYRSLFFIPGFSMFRSFNEKWYFVYAFFYALLFALSFFYIFEKKRVWAYILGLLVLGIVGYRLTPFVKGEAVNTVLWESKHVSTMFTLDSDFTSTIYKTAALPEDGKILTLPLTFPTYQVAYGEEGGAYVGVSAIQNLGGKKDFPGFWTFGPYEKQIFEAFRREDIRALTQFFSLLNIRYVFHNTDPRIMDHFPGFPYVAAGSMLSSKEQVPLIKNQDGYNTFLSQLPLQKTYEQGFYRLYTFDDTVVRPTVYIPDTLYASQSGALEGTSYRSSYGDPTICADFASSNLFCDGVQKDVPALSFIKRSETAYDITIDGGDRKEPFLVVLSEDYHNSWNLKIGERSEGITHIRINEYANAWVIDPNRVGNGVLYGSIMLEFQKYYTYGWMISGITFGILIIAGSYMMIRRKHGKK